MTSGDPCRPGETASIVSKRVREAMRSDPRIDQVMLVRACWAALARLEERADGRPVPRIDTIIAVDRSVVHALDEAARRR